MELVLAHVQQVVESFWIPLVQNSGDNVHSLQIVWEIIFRDIFDVVDDVRVAFGGGCWKVDLKVETMALDIVDVSHACYWTRQ